MPNKTNGGSCPTQVSEQNRVCVSLNLGITLNLATNLVEQSSVSETDFAIVLQLVANLLSRGLAPSYTASQVAG